MQRVLETVSLFVLIGVAILRPLVAESYDSAGSSLTDALAAVSDPSPLRTLVFNVLILCGAGGWLVARAVGSPRRYRWTGLEWGAVLVAIAAVVSCFAAGNKRLAINGTIDWLCYPILTIALVQLMHTRWHRRLLLAAVLATACVQAAHCFEQYFGFEKTLAHYQSIKADLWARQGVDLDSGKVEAFEQRMLSREASGLLPHSNITGSYLVLCGMAAVGAAIVRWTRRVPDSEPRASARAQVGATSARSDVGSTIRSVDARGAVWIARVFATIATALVLGAALLTKSLGAWIAAGVGAALWLLVHIFRRSIDMHRTRAVAIGWICVAAGVLGVVGHGLYHNSLPGWSLTFRWQYWRASASLIADHALTGVGRENFARHYLQYKLIESPEEVANPHNLFVQAAADWGVLGFVGVVVMMVGASVVITRRGSPPAVSAGLTYESPGRPAVVAWMVAFVLVVTVGRLPLLGTDDPAFLYYFTVTTGLCWVFGFACFAFGEQQAGRRVGASVCLPAVGAAIGLFAFVLHDMINFAAFVPGSATTLFALLAYCLSERSVDGPAPQTMTPGRRWWPVAVLTVGIVLVVLVAVRPVARAGEHLTQARFVGRHVAPVPIAAQIAPHHFEMAAQADPLDPTPYLEQTRWLMGASLVPECRDGALPRALGTIFQAIDRDPYSVALRRIRIQLLRSKTQVAGSLDDYAAAIAAAEDALALYPRDPHGVVTLADCQLEAGEATLSSERLQEAIDSYARALALDEARLKWEELHRFREKERKAIEARIQRARRLLEERS